LVLRQVRRAHGHLVGALGRPRLPVLPLLSAERCHLSYGQRAQDLSHRARPDGLHRDHVHDGDRLRDRQGVGLQIHLRRLPEQHRRGFRRGGSRRRHGRLHPADHVRRAGGPDRRALLRLHADVRHRLGVADVDVPHRSAADGRRAREQASGTRAFLVKAESPMNLQAKPAGPDISDWRPEDDAFWEQTGKRVAYRNLWISVPALLCGFAVWGMWGIITVQMLNLGFPFTQAELFTLTAIAGISGATMRIPASFLIRLAGGRNTIFLTTAML